jgi:hypothetical protein
VFVLCSRADDFIYANEMEGYEKSGVLSQLHVAFSRDRASKVGWCETAAPHASHHIRAA